LGVPTATGREASGQAIRMEERITRQDIRMRIYLPEQIFFQTQPEDKCSSITVRCVASL